MRIDPPVRQHLCGIASMACQPWPLRVIGGPRNLFATTGILPAELRAHMQLPSSAAQQRRFEFLLTVLLLADRVIPRRLWLLGYQMHLWDMRSRTGRGRRIV